MVMILGLLQNPTFTNLHCWVSPLKMCKLRQDTKVRTKRSSKRSALVLDIIFKTSNGFATLTRCGWKIRVSPSNLLPKWWATVMEWWCIPWDPWSVKKSSNKNKSKTLPWIHSRHIQRNMGRGCGPLFLGYTSSHNHGSQKWVPPIVVTFQILPFSTSMIMGERVKVIHATSSFPWMFDKHIGELKDLRIFSFLEKTHHKFRNHSEVNSPHSHLWTMIFFFGQQQLWTFLWFHQYLKLSSPQVECEPVQFSSR